MAVVTRTTVWVDGNVLTASALNGEFNNLLNALALTNSDIAGGAAIAYSKLNLTGSIVNADIGSGAAIAYSKLSLGSSIVNSDISGSAAIAYSKLALSGAIQNGDLAGSIAYSKLNLTGSIVNSDIANNASIATSKINVTFPSGTLVGTTDSQTLASKTLTKPILQASVQNIITDSDSSTITFDLSVNNIHTVTIAGNRTLALSSVSVGQVFMIDIVQGGTGNNVVTWFSTIKWPSGTIPTLTTTTGKTDSFGFLCTSAGNYLNISQSLNL
jgi:hypothetical protein